MTRSRILAPMVAALAAALTLTACGGGTSDSADGGASQAATTTTLSLVGYAVPQPGFEKVIPGFTATAAGKGVGFNQSYGASGDQSRKVVQGLAADVVAFSVEPDVTRLVTAGKVDSSWNTGQYKGVGFGSVVSLVVRKGNPKNIRTWDDLLRPGITVISPDPRSSGSAKWNLLAPYAAASEGGKNKQAGIDFVSKLVTDHIKARPGSGRDASDLFLQGSGDVLISYENEAINLQRQGKDIDFIDPPTTFKIENPVAVVKGSHETQARAFVDYITSSDGQKLWAQAGFRPVDPQVASETASQFPSLGTVYTISDLGGWKTVDKELFDKQNGLLTQVYAKATG